MSSFLKRLSDVAGRVKRIVIADFGLDDHYIKAVHESLSPILAAGVEVHWLDHHNWSSRALNMIAGLGVRLVKVNDREACGAQLVNRFFGNCDEYSELLAQIAYRTDFHLELNSLDGLLVDVVDYYNTLGVDDCDRLLERAARNISSGVLVDAVIYTHYLEYRRLESAAVESLLKNIHVFDAGTVRVAVGFTSDPLSSTKTCDIIREHYESDVQVAVKRRKVSFRRSRYDVDCSAIARLFRGGGHDYAASGELDFDVVDEETRRRALDIIKQRVEAAMSSSAGPQQD